MEFRKKELLGSAIAHEIKGPFASTQIALEVLQEILLSKIRPNKDKNEKELNIKMDRKDYDLLQRIARDLVDTAERGSKTIDMLAYIFKEQDSC